MEKLFTDKRIDERFKRIADKEMHRLILAERKNDVQTKQDWEYMVVKYAQIIETVVRMINDLPYSKDFLINQIEFLISDDLIGDRSYINTWNTERLLELLDIKNHRKLRHRFARFIVFHNCYSKFLVYDSKTEAIAINLIKEFEKEDSDLRKELKSLITGYRKNSEESSKQSQERLVFEKKKS